MSHRHSSFGYVPSIEYEAAYYRHVNPSSNHCRENSPSTKPGAIHYPNLIWD